MRALILAVCLISCAPPPCRNGTLFVRLIFSGDTAQADQAQLDITVDGATRTSVVPHTAGATIGSVEVTFPHGYPLGRSVEVTLTALAAGLSVGRGDASVTLGGGCMTLDLTAEPETPPDMLMPDLATPDLLPVAPTVSHLSPSGYSNMMNGTARPAVWTIASETPATIYYTTDGTTPSLGSPHGPSPLTTAALTDGTTLQWFSYNGRAETTQSFLVHVIAPSTTGLILESASLNGAGPVVTVAPGTIVAVQLQYQTWCAMTPCRIEMTYGVDTQMPAVGCFFDQLVSNMPYPGVSATGNFSVVAPTTPGVHVVRVAFLLQADCAAASAVGVPANNPIVGYMVVSP